MSPAERMKLYRSTNSMQALLPMEDRVGKIPRNKSSMRVQRTDRFVGSIRADEKFQFENMEKIEQPHIQSRPSFVASPSRAMSSIVRNNSLRREDPHTQVQSPTVTYQGVNRVKDIRGSRPSFLMPGLMGSRTTAHTNQMSMYESSPLMSKVTISDAPGDLNVHELTPFPSHIAMSFSPLHVGRARPRVVKTRELSVRKRQFVTYVSLASLTHYFKITLEKFSTGSHTSCHEKCVQHTSTREVQSKERSR